MKMLVVEDESMFAALVQRGLREDGHTVELARNCASARALLGAREYDGILLDVVLPDGDGYQILRDLRRDHRMTPVLMLTGKRGPLNVVRGLDAGADDYLTKPFDLDELKARVRALARRGDRKRVGRLALGDVSLDRDKRQVQIGERKVAMTPKEVGVLEYFLLRPEQVVTRSELLQNVWDMHFDPGSNVVDVHVARLRRKLGQARLVSIETVRGIGFVLTARSESRT
jgi:two-component system, OmpR family, response regulator